MPSKKVLSVIIIVIALVTAIIIAFGRDKSSQAINLASNLVAGEKVALPENSDWQKELENINQNGLFGNTQSTQKETSTTSETLTDVVSKSLMSNYLALKQSGTLDETSAQKLVDQTVSYIENSDGQKITTTNLIIIEDRGRQTIADYGQNLGYAFKNNKPNEVINEIEIISKAVSLKSDAELGKIEPVIKNYGDLAKDISKIPVPKTFVEAHLDLLNGLNGLISSLTQIKSAFNDPIKGLTAIQLYEQSSLLLTQSENAIRVFIKQNNIVYKQGDGGYYLLYGI